MKFAGIDFETYYDKAISVRTMGIEAYSRHPKAIVYAAALYTLDEHGNTTRRWVLNDGPVQESPDWPAFRELWASLLEDHEAVAHNARFEEAFIRNKLDLAQPNAWLDSADAAAFCDQGRALADVVHNMFGVKLSKEIRSAASGKLPVRGTPEWAEMEKYVADDAMWSVQAMAKCYPYWPAHERLISQLTLQMGVRGMAVDMGNLEAATEALKKAVADVDARLPWRNEDIWRKNIPERRSAKTGKLLKPDPLPAPTSVKALELQAKLDGIDLPTTVAGNAITDKKSEEFDAWVQDPINARWLPMQLMQQRRSLNRTLKVVDAIAARTVDGRCRYELKYCGAHTARDSGGGGLNMQNLSRDEVGGVNLRKIFTARPGYTLAVVDLASIEAVVLAYESGNRALYDLYAGGMDLYEAGARALGMYFGPSPMKTHDKAGRNLAKVAILSLGYGTGVDKFIGMAAQLSGGEVRLSWEQANDIVQLFRSRFRCVCNFWRKLEAQVFSDPRKFVDVKLPSRRSLRYYRPDPVAQTVRQTPTSRPVNMWGGSFTENYIQALCRDIFMSAWLRAGREVPEAIPVLRVHDEGVWEIPEDNAEETLHRLEKCLATSPAWYKDCVIGSEGKIVKHYQKI